MQHSSRGSFVPPALIIGALGVVFGDIGTSPLYALKECFNPELGVIASSENILGILSLIFWSLTGVVSIKYLFYILRADNRGEGGIMALLALLVPKLAGSQRGNAILYLGLFGAALLYGDGMITPAISVLSAVEGIGVATPAFSQFVVPITAGILIALFSLQKHGTARIGAIFGPTTLIWFLVLAAMGFPWIMRSPEVIRAINPAEAFEFFSRQPKIAFLSLSSVVLCITGAEALYADMGHFGREPIRLGWLWIVKPALLLNYFGQGAYLLSLIKDSGALPHGIESIHPFYGMVSTGFVIPLVMIATAATVIASQALITGAYSLTQQAVQLGYLPRMDIRHTSASAEGQIYIPSINAFLMISCLALVVYFQKSSELAAAYGIAVTGTMVITSLLFFHVSRKLWHWSFAKAAALLTCFLLVDGLFFASNALKLSHGGWIPVLIAFAIFCVMTTWKRGRAAIADRLMQNSCSLSQFIASIPAHTPRVAGTSVFMTLSRDVAPSVLLHHFRHNHSLHQYVVLLSVVTKNIPFVDSREKVRVTEMDSGFYKVLAQYGYMESPDITEILGLCEGAGLRARMDRVSFYLGRERYIYSDSKWMPHWRKRLFAFMSRNARPATDYFRIPPDQVMELGAQIAI